jgi:DNA-binding IclR family transcriptional regulator
MTCDRWKTTNPADAELGNATQQRQPMTVREKILEALQQAPKGLTSRQLAEAVGKPLDNVSSCAGKLCIAGKIERDSISELHAVERKTILWRARQ